MDPLGVEVKQHHHELDIFVFNKFLAFLNPQELFSFLKKEYCHENLRFWLSVQELKRGPGSEQKIKKKVKEIYE